MSASTPRLQGTAPAVRARLDSWTSAACLRGYLQAAQGTSFVPADPAELRDALEGYLLEKALQELSLELTLRPGWTRIPLRGTLQLVEGPPWG